MPPLDACFLPLSERIDGRHTRNLAPIDAVLFDPVVDGGRSDVEVVGGLRDRPTGSHERNGSSTELSGIGRRHGLSFSLRPNFNKRKDNKTQGRSISTQRAQVPIVNW